MFDVDTEDNWCSIKGGKTRINNELTTMKFDHERDLIESSLCLWREKEEKRGRRAERRGICRCWWNEIEKEKKRE